jgi:hypothetical protein
MRQGTAVGGDATGDGPGDGPSRRTYPAQSLIALRLAEYLGLAKPDRAVVCSHPCSRGWIAMLMPMSRRNGSATILPAHIRLICAVTPHGGPRIDAAPIRRSVSESRRFLCHALYSAELAACREISALLQTVAANPSAACADGTDQGDPRWLLTGPAADAPRTGVPPAPR